MTKIMFCSALVPEFINLAQSASAQGTTVPHLLTRSLYKPHPPIYVIN